MLQIGVGAIADASRETAPNAWHRTFTIMLDGLRSRREGTRPFTQPPLPVAEFEAVLRGSVPKRR